MNWRSFVNTPRRWQFAFVVLVLAFSALLALQLGHGLASVDGHGAIRATRAMVDEHRLEVSRPPGHPATEYYLFGGVALILKSGFGKEFGAEAYLWLQAIAAVLALIVFFRLLRRIADPSNAFLACVALAFSPQFFANAVDGEEFVWALLLLLLSIQLLLIAAKSQSQWKYVFGSAACFALATGCRPEAIFAGVMFPIYFRFHPDLGLRDAVRFALILCALILLVWVPVLVVGLQPPWTAGMSLRESLLGGAYRLLFQCFNPAVFILFCWILVREIADLRNRTREPFPENFLYLAAFVTPLIFGAALFLHASKAAHALFVVPFLLILSLRRRALLVTVTIGTLIGFLVSVDIFKDRQLVRPHLVAGGYSQAVRPKPYYKADYLRGLLAQLESRPTLIVADAWSWDFEYNIARGAFTAHEEHRPGAKFHQVSIFHPPQGGDSVLLPRDFLIETGLLQDFAKSGYVLKMDRLLYRTVFSRYDITMQMPDEGMIGDLHVVLF